VKRVDKGYVECSEFWWENGYLEDRGDVSEGQFYKALRMSAGRRGALFPHGRLVDLSPSVVLRMVVWK